MHHQSEHLNTPWCFPYKRLSPHPLEKITPHLELTPGVHTFIPPQKRVERYCLFAKQLFPSSVTIKRNCFSYAAESHQWFLFCQNKNFVLSESSSLSKKMPARVPRGTMIHTTKYIKVSEYKVNLVIEIS